MSVRVTWQPSLDIDIASYDLERAASIGGPWSLVANVPHQVPGPNWDIDATVFFYEDALGTGTSYYRLTAIDAANQRSPVSTPFRASNIPIADIPALINTLSIPVAGVSTLLDLGFTTIEVWKSDDEGGLWTELNAPTEQNPNTRLLLVEGATLYNFYDPTGPAHRRYRWRFSNNGAQPVSKWSEWVEGKPQPIANAPLSIAIARFVSVDGRPSRRTVLIASETDMLGGYAVGDESAQLFRTDETGLVQIPLLIGAKVRVAVEGAGVVRTITVPNAPTFDLLQAIAEAPDEFEVQSLPPLLTKRSL